VELHDEASHNRSVAAEHDTPPAERLTSDLPDYDAGTEGLKDQSSSS